MASPYVAQVVSLRFIGSQSNRLLYLANKNAVCAGAIVAGANGVARLGFPRRVGPENIQAGEDISQQFASQTIPSQRDVEAYSLATIY